MLVVVDLCLIYALVNGHVDSSQLARASFHWLQNPSADTSRELGRQKRINDRIEFSFEAAIIGLIAANTYFLVRTCYRLRAPTQDPKKTG